MLSLWIIGLFLGSAFACGSDQTWERIPDEGQMNIYINKTLPGEYELLTWQWMTATKDGIWSMTLKRWPKLEYTTGTLKYKNLITNSFSHVGWKIKQKTLTWSKSYGKIFQPAWNMSVCNFAMDWGFIPAQFGDWSFRIGNLSMSANVGSSPIKEITVKRKLYKRRNKRAPEGEEDAEEIPLDIDMGDGTNKPSIITWILRKTGLEQGDNDERSWWERIADLVLSWFKAMFV